MSTPVRYWGPLILVLGTAACVPREIERGFADPATPFRPYPHEAIVQSGVYRHLFADGAVVVDSFSVYHSVRGGYVLHARSGSSRFPFETWFEVAPDFTPLRGWERADGPSGRCEWSFGISPKGIDVRLKTPASPETHRLHFSVPGRYTVATRSVISLIWGVASARETGTLSVLEFGHCTRESPQESGFVAVQIETVNRKQSAAAGRSFSVAVVRLLWPRGRVDEILVADSGPIAIERRSPFVLSYLDRYWSVIGD